jgi:hypothetical protein
MGFVGMITSVKPSAIQYARMNNAGEMPRDAQMGATMGTTSIIFAEAEPINICKTRIRK